MTNAGRAHLQGCDGSILLQDTSSGTHVERDATDNLSLQQAAFDAIDQAKAAVEAQCPGVVSCSDILVMAAEDVVGMVRFLMLLQNTLFWMWS